jgi:dipeptidyl aminopeptidase/acylaminoacyl peptidase
LLISAAAGRAAAKAPAPLGRCADILPIEQAVHDRRPVSARDLATLRDIGRPDSLVGGDGPLGLSPDGRSVAFILSRADPDTNLYCRALVVLELRPGARPRILDSGGDFISMTYQDLRGAVTPTGVADVAAPKWSPDSRSIAYLRRDNGKTQIWRVSVDLADAEKLTSSRVDIEAFAWTSDGKSIVFASRPALLDTEAAIDREARAGYLYDDRIVPVRGGRPMVRGPLPCAYRTVDLDSRQTRSITPDEKGLIEGERQPGLPPQAMAAASGEGGRRAWLAPTLPGRYLSPVDLWARDGQRRDWRCTAQSCRTGIVALWWEPHGNRVRYLRQEGPGNGRMAFYLWKPGAGVPRRTFASDDVFVGCLPSGTRFICLRDGSINPRRLVRLDPDTGTTELLLDPNPEFRSLILGRVHRLVWKNEFGFETFGDLVLPSDYRRGEKLPLIVVQYTSRGFLRGGTGDEYPILAFAARGFAVLSVQQPLVFNASLPLGNWHDWKDAEPENMRGWRERRSVTSSVVAGIAAASALGVVDPKRIGLTGLSDGTTTAWYLLSNTNMFAATSVSTCCADPKTDQILGGLAWETERQRFGYPAPTDDNAGFWSPVSPAMNASRIAGPVLMQLADDEYLRALEAFSAFRTKGPPVEMYVFPDEHHIKWQPAHRLAIYERNLDWFSFWLQGREDSDPAKVPQYVRWRALRAGEKSRW